MMATFVLVHGAWHGGWCWSRLIPSLTGLGDRAHLLSPEVGLSTHIQDITGLMDAQDLGQVLLVGHKYGCMVITGAADRAPARGGHLVYFDTFVPRDGESMADIAPLVIGRFREKAQRHGNGWRVDPPKERPFGVGGLYGVTEEPDRSWVRAMVMPQPLKIFEEPLRLADPEIVSRFPRTHILCTGGGRFFALIGRLLGPRGLPPKAPGWRLRRLPTAHDAMITMPRASADLLLEAAEGTPRVTEEQRPAPRASRAPRRCRWRPRSTRSRRCSRAPTSSSPRSRATSWPSRGGRSSRPSAAARGTRPPSRTWCAFGCARSARSWSARSADRCGPTSGSSWPSSSATSLRRRFGAYNEPVGNPKACPEQLAEVGRLGAHSLTVNNAEVSKRMMRRGAKSACSRQQSFQEAGIVRVGEPILAWFVRRTLERAYAQLKTQLEARAC